MRLRPPLAWLAVPLVCLLVAGCGSDDDSAPARTGEDAAVAAAIKRYLTAMGSLDAAGACGALTSAAQDQLVAQSGSTQRSCEELLRYGFQLMNQEQRKALAEQASLEPFEIVVSGRRATGQLQYRGQISRFDAEKARGVWKLSSPGEQQFVPG